MTLPASTTCGALGLAVTLGVLAGNVTLVVEHEPQDHTRRDERDVTGTDQGIAPGLAEVTLTLTTEPRASDLAYLLDAIGALALRGFVEIPGMDAHAAESHVVVGGAVLGGPQCWPAHTPRHDRDRRHLQLHTGRFS